MEVSEAETKICPFIQSRVQLNEFKYASSNEERNINCVTSNCMAWEYTKEDNTIENEIETCKCGDSTNTHSLCEKCETRAGESHGTTKISTFTPLATIDEDDKEGFCIRLKL